ncbi:unnamed protein product [Adineta steineri]|uniref:F-box domain-containing protein n=1 Tax=Adineta steineri TaxID=433720 RepID=A0A813Y0Q7_9BILA|nr:unnamed protein product [Adineta steineri]CAF0913383.1 unnamed protein product [Adineta steineri]
MVRLAKKRNDDENLQSNSVCSNQDTSLALLCLPNELLEIILSYLSSSAIVQSFFEINSDRIQAILLQYLVHFDFVPVMIDTEQRIKKYFRNDTRLSHCISSLRLTGRQMNILSKYNIQLIQLESFHIINIEDNTVLFIDLLKIAPLLRSLSLEYSSDDMSHDDTCCLARILFNNNGAWQQQLQSLSINKIYIPFGFQSVQLMTSLEHLKINIRYEKQLFDLCCSFPHLKSLHVVVRDSSSNSFDQLMNISNVSKCLKKLIIIGKFSSYLTLYKFILMYESSLEDLTLKNIYHPDPINGQQLQSELIKHLYSLIHFRFHFQFPIKTEEFHKKNYLQTFDWIPVMIDSKIDNELTVITVSSFSTQN